MTPRVNIIIITHEKVGEALLHAVKAALGEHLPLSSTVITVSSDANPEKITLALKKLIEETESLEGFLVLTDLFGSTPANIAANLQKMQQKDKIRVVAGLNLPMLIRVMNYPDLSLPLLAEKAISGGKDGVINY